MSRALTSALALCVGLVVLGGLAGCRPSAADFNGTFLDPPMPARDVTLASPEGPVQMGDFAGDLVVLNFGYTSCPDVCPATLARLARAKRLLGADGDGVQVVFVSLDPERDRPERAAGYAATFDSSFVGLSGTPEQIADAAAAYGVFYEKAGGADGAAVSEAGYLVDHTATVFVLDGEGRPRLLWSFGTDAEAMAADLRALLRAS
jgi:protein SCO1/2